MTLPYRILAVLALLAAAFGSGWVGHVKYRAGVDAQAALAASEQARKADHDSAVSKIRALDSYSVSAAGNAARALPARDDLRGMQHSLATIAAAGVASSCGVDPRLAGLADLLGEGAGLVEEGARVADELRAQRNALR